MNTARDDIFASVRAELGRTEASPLLPRPPVVPARQAGSAESELTLLCEEVEKLGGVARRLAGVADLAVALADLVAAEGVRTATVWPTADMKQAGVEALLTGLGVELVSPRAGKAEIADCDLGVTGADFALPETGTIALLSDDERPRMVSLVPRVHLAIVRLAALRADLHQVFAEARSGSYLICITGPSRTADIELTLTIGVHGPRSVHIWIIG
jgi:L-lactate dehydrogenase complex protein LldG